MKNGILNELISTMRERIPQDMNLANTLADILCMGKEAVYRRLRGEMSFYNRRSSAAFSKTRYFYRPDCR